MSTQNIEDYLDTLNESEIAFLLKYAGDSYMADSKQRILDYVKKRQIKPQTITSLISKFEFNPENQGCPRCNSEKTIKEKIIITNQYLGWDGLIGKEHFIITDICQICGFSYRDYKSKEMKRFKRKRFFRKLFRLWNGE